MAIAPEVVVEYVSDVEVAFVRAHVPFNAVLLKPETTTVPPDEKLKPVPVRVTVVPLLDPLTLKL